MINVHIAKYKQFDMYALQVMVIKKERLSDDPGNKVAITVAFYDSLLNSLLLSPASEPSTSVSTQLSDSVSIS